jgi:hypothetical protein
VSTARPSWVKKGVEFFRVELIFPQDQKTVDLLEEKGSEANSKNAAQWLAGGHDFGGGKGRPCLVFKSFGSGFGSWCVWIPLLRALSGRGQGAAKAQKMMIFGRLSWRRR